MKPDFFFHNLLIFKELVYWWINQLGAFFFNRQFSTKCTPSYHPLVLCRNDSVRVFAPTDGQFEKKPIYEVSPSGMLPNIKKLRSWLNEKGSIDCYLALPFDRCFVREITVPATSKENIHKILQFELEQSTPFELGDVFLGYQETGYERASRKIKINQYIAKREIVEDQSLQAEGFGACIKGVCVLTPKNAKVLPVKLFAGSSSFEKRPLGSVAKLVSILCMLCIGLAIGFVFQLKNRQIIELNMIEAAIEKRKIEAKKVLEVLDSNKQKDQQLKSLYVVRQKYVRLTKIIDELTSILPDDTWISELTIDDRKLKIVGFTPSASYVVGLLDKSVTFSKPSLSASILFDSAKKKQRFTIDLSVHAEGVF